MPMPWEAPVVTSSGSSAGCASCAGSTGAGTAPSAEQRQAQRRLGTALGSGGPKTYAEAARLVKRASPQSTELEVARFLATGDGSNLHPPPNAEVLGAWENMAKTRPDLITAAREQATLQEVIDARAAKFTNRIDNGYVNSMVGASKAMIVNPLNNATTDLENAWIERENGNRIQQGLKPLPRTPDRPAFFSDDELNPACGPSTDAAFDALKADPRFAGWEVKKVTHASSWEKWTGGAVSADTSQNWPGSGYHHKVYAKSPSGNEYSVDLWRGREIRAWDSNDADSGYKPD